jgi:hypothetical protein
MQVERSSALSVRYMLLLGILSIISIMYLLNNPGEHGSKVQSTAIGNAEHFSTR